MRRWGGAALAAVAALAPLDRAAADEPTQLYLVTLHPPGASLYDGPLRFAYRALLVAGQDDVLDQVGSTSPVYRWTSALSGFAVRLTDSQAGLLRDDPAVDTVEADSIQHLAALGSRLRSTNRVVEPDPVVEPSRDPDPRTGGAGVVIGVIDSGVWPDGPAFADVPDLGAEPASFGGVCDTEELCNDKVVTARWFVDGFGSEQVRSASSLSARDDSGHGTLVASIAAGNAGVSARVGSLPLGDYAGAAPQARLAIYKACWTAPDPSDDGCSAADVVTAIDQATSDGVDVLNLSIAGAGKLDVVDQALLGATRAGVFVAAAAGNSGGSGHADHPVPWVTTVGASANAVPGGALVLTDGNDGTELRGAMAARRSVTAPLVVARSVAAPGVAEDQSAVCAPGSLDAGRVRGAIVLCERGQVGRVDKSRAVALADGVGMVLANGRGDDIHADFHAVPTVHLSHAAATRLEAWLTSHAGVPVTLRPGGPAASDRGPIPGWSAPGDPAADLVKPDLVAPGIDVLGAEQPTFDDPGPWNVLTGTSAATAAVSGAAARVLGVHPSWTPDQVRSALMTTAARAGVRTPGLRQGAGRVDADAALHPGLVYAVSSADYVSWLGGRLPATELNLPSIKVRGPATVHRTVTSVGSRAMYYSVTASGFSRHRVRVQPEAIRILPGHRATYTVTITGPGDRIPDSGWITWLGNNGITVRIPVVIAR
jgi:minor extracellular serine protease Vpr